MSDTPYDDDQVVVVDTEAATHDGETSPGEATSDAAEARDEVAELAAKENAQGYRGEVPDPLPNSAHSLASGPDSPPLAPDNTTRAGQPTATKEAE